MTASTALLTTSEGPMFAITTGPRAKLAAAKLPCLLFEVPCASAVDLFSVTPATLNSKAASNLHYGVLALV